MSAETRVRVEPSSRVARNEAIIFTELDDAVVMMDAEAGSYYELDPVGSRIWALAESRPRVADVCAELVAEYEVAPDTCADEVRAFLEELRRLEVMRIAPGNGANETGNHDLCDPAATPRGGARLAWITPVVRRMAVSNTRAGFTSVYWQTEGTFYADPPPTS